MLKEFFDKLIFKPDPVRMYSYGLSDVGRSRKLNEDNYLIDEKLGLFIVADGMGGHDAGEVASKLAIETLFNHIKKLTQKYQASPRNSLPDEEESPTITDRISGVLQDAIEEANNQTHCYNIARGFTEGQGMGTTVTGFWIGSAEGSLSADKSLSSDNPFTTNDSSFTADGSSFTADGSSFTADGSSFSANGSTPRLTRKIQLYTFNIGDSRIYRFSQGKLDQLSTDHSHYQLWIETGKEGPPPKHNIIYKAIGPWRRIVAEQHIHPIHFNELFLLCSDGLCDMLSDKKIRDILHINKNKNLKEIAHALVAAANKAGGKDNITVVLVKP